MLAFDLPLLPGYIDSDTALIRDCQAGSIEAYGLLVTRYRDGIYNFVRHTVGPGPDAQDLAQEAFVRAYAAIGRFRVGAPFEPWLYTIAANLCRSHLRQVNRRARTYHDADGIDHVPAPLATDPARDLERRDEHQRLLNAIHCLPVDQRMVVVLRHLQNRPYKEIAAILELPVSTVEHRLRAARQSLWKTLHDDQFVSQEGGV